MLALIVTPVAIRATTYAAIFARLRVLRAIEMPACWAAIPSRLSQSDQAAGLDRRERAVGDAETEFEAKRVQFLAALGAKPA